eukprot:2679162-Pyramimonas_sp.AAC.1
MLQLRCTQPMRSNCLAVGRSEEHIPPRTCEIVFDNQFAANLALRSSSAAQPIGTARKGEGWATLGQGAKGRQGL